MSSERTAEADPAAIGVRAFAGKVAIVTGGAGAIGQSVGRHLHLAGAAVVLADRVQTEAPAWRAPHEGAIELAVVDVSQRAQVNDLVRSTQARFGRIDILVNVAGITSHGSAENLPEDEWDRVLAVNLKGTFLCCQAVIPAMRAQSYGRIVNLGSVIGKNSGNPRPWISRDEQLRAGNVAYGVSKAGVHAMTGFLAKELASSGVTVNAVAPGPIASAMTAGFPESLRALIPVGRIGTTDEVARAVLFLASEGAGFITGEVLDINGGMWCD